MKKTILVVIDGCRPDQMLQSEAPHLNEMMEQGTYTLEAQGVHPPITLPTHFSIFSGMKPLSHGVLANTSRPSPAVEAKGIMDWAKLHGRDTAAFYNWAFLRNLFGPYAVDWSIVMDRAMPMDSDMRMAVSAAAYLCRIQADFSFLYLGHPDEIGHIHGYESREYRDSISRADEAIGYLRRSLEAAGLADEFTWLVVSDHGGKNHDHTIPSPEVMTVPWIACGPGIRQGHRLESSVSLLDCAPTIANLLDLPAMPYWEGRLVEGAIA